MRDKSGFTIMEMLVVIAIIGIVSAATVPNFISWRATAQVSSSARQIYSDLQKARTTAIKSNSTVNLNFNRGTNLYTLNGQQRFLPGGVVISNAEFGPDPDDPSTLTNVASFNNMGFARKFSDVANGGAVTVSLSGGARTSTILVETAGNIRILND